MAKVVTQFDLDLALIQQKTAELKSQFRTAAADAAAVKFGENLVSKNIDAEIAKVERLKSVLESEKFESGLKVLAPGDQLGALSARIDELKNKARSVVGPMTQSQSLTQELEINRLLERRVAIQRQIEAATAASTAAAAKMGNAMQASTVNEFRGMKARAEKAAAEAARAAAAEWTRIVTPAVTDSWRVHQASGMGAFGRGMPGRGGGGGMRGLGNAGIQLQDVAVQAQMGTNASVIIGQQGSQLLGALGPGGAVAGAVLALGAAFVTMGQKGKEQFEKLKTEAAAFAEETERLLAAGDADALAVGYGKIEERLQSLNKLADEGATVWGRFKAGLAGAMGGEDADGQAAELMNQRAQALEQAFDVQKRALAVSAEDLEISRARAAGEMARVRRLERARELAQELAKIDASNFGPGAKAELAQNAKESSRLKGEAEDEQAWKDATQKRLALTQGFQEAQKATDDASKSAAMQLVALAEKRLDLESKIKAASGDEAKLKLATERESVEKGIVEAQKRLASEAESAEATRQKNIENLQGQIQETQTAGLPPLERVRALGDALRGTFAAGGVSGMGALDTAIAGAANSQEKERLLGLKKKAMEQEAALKGLLPAGADTVYQTRGDFGKAAGFLSGQNPNEMIAVSLKDQASKVAESNELLKQIREILKATNPGEPVFKS
jgi:hypothetical protein